MKKVFSKMKVFFFKTLVPCSILLIVVLGCGAKRELRESKYPNGQLKEQYFVKLDKNGNYVRDGQYNKWYENGQKEATGTYKNGPTTDTATDRDPIPLRGCDGKWIVWYENGQKETEGTYKDGKREGLYTWWHQNGQKDAEGTYKDGKREGPYTEWYENGQKKSEETFKDGKPDGIVIEWYENGQKKSEEIFKDDKPDGIGTEWYENGQKKSERTFKDGEKEGIKTEWYENGQKAADSTFKDGKLEGPYTAWDKNGHKTDEGTYKDGEKEVAIGLSESDIQSNSTITELARSDTENEDGKMMICRHYISNSCNSEISCVGDPHNLYSVIFATPDMNEPDNNGFEQSMKEVHNFFNNTGLDMSVLGVQSTGTYLCRNGNLLRYTFSYPFGFLIIKVKPSDSN